MVQEKNNTPSGFLLIDKPTDWTSHDVVGYLRRVTGIKKIGHAGTLDPFATGLLIVGIGREATKRLDDFKGMPKEYIATVQLGAVSDTQDRTGNIQDTNHTLQINQTEIQAILKQCIGSQQQIPPMYSAKKVQGKKLYELARAGKEITRKPIEIEIFDIELQHIISQDTFTMRVSCSTGTYIRTLCHDIGQMLGTGAYCAELRRTKIGLYEVQHAIPPKHMTALNWQDRLLQLEKIILDKS